MILQRLLLKRKDEIGVDENCLLSKEDFRVAREALLFTTRTDGEFCGRAMALSDKYDWIIGEDSFGIICLVPFKKENEGI